MAVPFGFQPFSISPWETVVPLGFQPFSISSWETAILSASKLALVQPFSMELDDPCSDIKKKTEK